jgi:anti-sigma B factor antagonist
MEITERRVADRVVLSITGDLTMGQGGRMELVEKVRQLLQQGHRQLVLELGSVRYVDSSGLGELAESNAAAHTRGASLKLLHVGRRLSDLLVLTRLDAVFEYGEHDSNTEAAGSFERRSSPGEQPR